MARIPKKILRELKQAREAATMKNAGFSDALKEETRNYRETWIVGPLARVIAWAENPKRQF